MNLKDAFDGMAAAQSPTPIARPLKVQTAKRPDVQGAKPLDVQTVGKSRHPDYTQVTIYMRKETHKRAKRKWEDSGAGGDFSELMEMLAAEYLKG